MAQILTVEELLAATETTVVLPLLSESLGEERSIRVRKIGRVEYLSFLPPLPPEAAEWPADDMAERERAWLKTLSPEQLEARRAEARRLQYCLVAIAAIDPVLTIDQAQHLGDDAAVVAAEVLRFSGLWAERAGPAPADPLAEPPVNGAP